MLKAKNCVIGSKIGLNINGEDNEDIGMIVNEHYEACFIEEKGENSKFLKIAQILILFSHLENVEGAVQWEERIFSFVCCQSGNLYFQMCP